MANNKISVIIPAYNEEEHIGRCIDSILADDFPQDNFEIIVIDDGSTDNTINIAKSYPVKIIKMEQNKGAAAARNTGIASASGDILIFIDADATLEKGSLKEHFGQHKYYDIVYGSYRQMYGDQVFAKYSKAYADVCWKGQNINFNNTSYKRFIFDNLRFDENMKACYYEDTDMIEQILAKNYRIFRSDKIIASHFPHEKNFSSVLKKNFGAGSNLPIYTLKHFSIYNFVKPFVIPFLVILSLFYFPVGLFIALVFFMFLHPNIIDVITMSKRVGLVYLLPFILISFVLKMAFFSGVTWGIFRAIKVKLFG